MASFEIIRTEEEGARFLDRLSKAVDDHRSAFGFAPRTLYSSRLRASGLWILTKEDEYAGHVMFGGALPTLKVWQLFVLPQHRGHGLARKLIDELVDHAELEGYGSIRARVASDLSANVAWEHLGFKTLKTAPGGATTGRTINVRLRRLQPRGSQTHMLTVLDGLGDRQAPAARGLPINRSHWYTLDINVWLDFVEGRQPFFEDARALLEEARKDRLRLRFTSEAVGEARRSSDARIDDHLLKTVTSWQTLPASDEVKLANLVAELREIIFPFSSPTGRRAANELSDLRHLAISIDQKASGFITRDRALLRHRRRIWSRFGLDVLRPTDLLEAEDSPVPPRSSLSDEFRVERVEHTDAAVERFGSAAIDGGARLRRLDPDDQAWACSVAGEVVGLCYWHTQVMGDTEAYLCTKEGPGPSIRQRSLDVLLGLLFSASRSGARIHRILLHVDEDTVVVFCDDLLDLGFFRTRESDLFVRFASGAPLELVEWELAKEVVEKETGASSEWIKNESAGPVLRLRWGDEIRELDRFDIETRFGITALTLDARRAFYVPVQERHANELLPLPRRPTLFTCHDAAFRTERVYFRNPVSSAALAAGDLLFFYVSGEIGEIWGMARCTASQVLHKDDAAERYRRLAVLDPGEVGNEVHCIAFDGYLPFRAPVTLAWMRRKGLEAKNNFQTIARVPDEPPGRGYLQILVEGLARR